VSIDKVRIKRYLVEIRKHSSDLRKLVEENRLSPDAMELKAAKYMLIELAEAVSNTTQHILAKEKGLTVSGYVDTIVKAFREGIISKNLFEKMKPFLDFRNSLIHRYWTIDDTHLIENIQNGYKDFDQFVEEIESYLKHIDSSI
jgi:uncharacterized protein YutE (UPF0331/DUF86 family)